MPFIPKESLVFFNRYEPRGIPCSKPEGIPLRSPDWRKKDNSVTSVSPVNEVNGRWNIFTHPPLVFSLQPAFPLPVRRYRFQAVLWCRGDGLLIWSECPLRHPRSISRSAGPASVRPWPAIPFLCVIGSLETLNLNVCFMPGCARQGMNIFSIHFGCGK